MAETNLQLEDWLDDLCVRFIINLPQDDLSSVPRICFQVEEAQWYYEDFIRPLDPSLPTMSLRSFCLKIFAHCPLLSAFSQENHVSAFEDFLQYKIRVPVRGAIMLNDTMDSVVLVKGWKKNANWSFPRGKINMNEDDLDCAVREVYEETGYDLNTARLVPHHRQVKFIEINIRDQNLRLYVFKDVPMDTNFEPRTRKEISKIKWWHLSDLPAFRRKGQQPAEPVVGGQKFYNVAPFLIQLKKWIANQKRQDAKRNSSNNYLSAGMSHDELLTEEDQGSQTMAAGGAPNKTAMDDASAALNRLLIIQPPTEGLQMDASILLRSPVQPASSDKGAALLALLKPHASKDLTSIKPRTPAEQIVSQSLASTSPHGHSQGPQYSKLLPRSAFPAQHKNQTYSYEEKMNRSQANQLPPGQNQLSPQVHQPQQLAHPQPLPHHVHSAMITSEPVRSPAVSQSIYHQSGQQEHPSPAIPLEHPRFAEIHMPTVDSQPRQLPAQLTSHKLALLNAFQSRDQAAGSQQQLSDHYRLRMYTEGGIASPPTQPQELPAEPGDVKSKPFPSPFGLPHSIAPPASPNSLLPKTRITTSHQSTLLSMFKSSPTGAASPALSLSATALPLSGTHSAVELSAAGPMSAQATRSTGMPQVASTNVVPGRTSWVPGISESTTEKSISSKLPETTQLHQPAIKLASDRLGRTKSHKRIGSAENILLQRQLERTFQPRILKRPQPLSAQPSATTASTSAKSPLSTTFVHHPSQSDEHVRTLLSLFGKPSAPPKLSSSSHLTEAVTPIPQADPPARSRIGSLASAPQIGSPRTSPISSADKGFLLGYLDAVAKGGGVRKDS